METIGKNLGKIFLLILGIALFLCGKSCGSKLIESQISKNHKS